MNDVIWNPWHGCKKYSEGCQNCYVYRRDESIGKDASRVTKTSMFDLPLRKNKNGEYKIPFGSSVYICMTSDFFIDEADTWRPEIWNIIRERSDISFKIITKRILRLVDCIPPDWGSGYDNVSIITTIECQRTCNERLPYFITAPIKRKGISCEPLLSPINLLPYLSSDISLLIAGGESGQRARMCDYNWVLDLREQCIKCDVPFYFKQTGANFLKDGKLYQVPRKLQHSQARKAKINTTLSLTFPAN